MKYTIQRFEKIFFETNSLWELKRVFEKSIGEMTINYMIPGKDYDVFCCKDGYSLLIKR